VYRNNAGSAREFTLYFVRAGLCNSFLSATLGFLRASAASGVLPRIY
jgi:hypothetical protein